MSVYIITIVLVLYVGIMEKKLAFSTIGNFDKKGFFIARNRTNIFYFLLMGVFLFVGGFRYYVGADYGAYYNATATLTTVIEDFRDLDEPAMELLIYICRCISSQQITVIFVSNAIIVVCLFIGIKKYRTEDFIYPLLLYMFYGGWLFTFNGVRQSIALSIIFAFAGDVGSKKYIKSLLAILVAYLFHKSAIFMLPIVLLSFRKIDKRQILFIIGMIAAVYYRGAYFYSYMDATVESVGEYATNSINVLRIAVAFVPVLLFALAYLQNIRNFFENNHYIINLTLINAGLTLATYNSAYMNRISYFTVIYYIIFLPKYFEYCNENTRRLLKLSSVVLFFLFFYKEVNPAYVPFKWWFIESKI